MSQDEYQDKVFTPRADEIPHLQEFLKTTKDLAGSGIYLEEINYFDLCFGFMLAKEVDPHRAHDLACYARYDLEIA